MISFFKKKYLVGVEFSKHGGKYYPRGPKSNNHKGTQVSNQYIQFVMTIRNPDKIIRDIGKVIKEKYPNSNNYRITDIIRL